MNMPIKKVPIIIYLLVGFSLGYITFFVNDIGDDTSPAIFDEYSDTTAYAQEEVTIESIPSIELEIHKDFKRGYNIKIITENFLWTPARVSTQSVQGEGHAHLYVNGEKIARVYGPWFHLDKHHLKEGQNIVRMALSTNDHSDWSVEGEVIESIVILGSQ